MSKPNKWQALQQFWESFGIPAYDENTVDFANAQMPYITYEAETDSFDRVLTMSGSLWYRGTSWTAIDAKADEISRALNEHGHWIMEIDGGYLWVNAGEPFARRMIEPEDRNVRRIVLNIEAEFLSAY